MHFWKVGRILVVALTVAITGCSKPAPRGKPPEAIVGTWVEVRSNDPAISGRILTAGPNDPKFRQFQFNADKTFVMTFVDEDGKAVSPELNAKGRWEYKDGKIQFETTENKVGEKYAGWLPNVTNGVRDIPVEGGSVERMTVYDKSDDNCYLKKATP